MHIVSIGEILWDVFGQREFLGGAPLNFSANAQRLANSVTLISAVGDDPRGMRALQSMTALGLSTEFIQTLPGKKTGTAVVTTDPLGNANYFIERPAAFDQLQLDEAQLGTLQSLKAAWFYFGTLAQTNPSTNQLLDRILHHIPAVRCFYDMNLREGHWNHQLVRQLSRLSSVVKLNETEAETLFDIEQPSKNFTLESFCCYWSSAYAVDTICVTLGGDGCAIFSDGAFSRFHGFKVKVADTVGAGDAFAAAFLHGLELGWPMAKTATFANALGALVASRPGATPLWSEDECRALIAEQHIL